MGQPYLTYCMGQPYLLYETTLPYLLAFYFYQVHPFNILVYCQKYGGLFEGFSNCIYCTHIVYSTVSATMCIWGVKVLGRKHLE